MKIEGLAKADELYREKVARIWNPDCPTNADLMLEIGDIRAKVESLHGVLKALSVISELQYNALHAALELLLAECD